MTLPFNELFNNFRGTGPFLFAVLAVALAVTALMAVSHNTATGAKFWPTWWRFTLPVLSVWSIAGIMLVGLRPGETGMPPQPSELLLDPLADFDQLDPERPWDAGRLIVGNILLFIPAGFFLALWQRKMRVWQIVLAGFGLSLGVELAQLWFVADRSASTGDLVTNTMGAAIGALAGRGLHLAFLRWRRGDSNP